MWQGDGKGAANVLFGFDCNGAGMKLENVLD
jgi:hypothetical protein